MNFKVLLPVLGSLLMIASAQAQWQSVDYSLKGGWNSIYLSGDAKYDTIENLFPNSGQTANVLEIWRWNPNPNQVQFTESPLIPSAGTPEWSVWVRGGGSSNTLNQLSGPAAYLVKCAGTASNTYVVQLKQLPLPPGASWVRNGANLMGFPTFKNGANYPTFSNYFATFPAAIAANVKIYKYVGGELGAGNPLQVFSTSTERLDRTQAYWFSAKVVGDFTAPIEITSNTNNGLYFGRSGAVVTVYVRNRTAAAVTLTLAPSASAADPSSPPATLAQVPLTRRTFNATTLLWTETDISSAYTVVVGPQSTVELSFGINRPAMTSASAVYASLLRVTDSSNLMDVYLPVTATKDSLAGLWVGDVSLTNVSSQVTNTAKATATVTNGAVTSLSVSGTGGYGYATAPTVTIAPPASGTTATATAIVAAGAVRGFTITNAGSGYAVASPQVTIAAPSPLAGSSTPRPFTLRTLLHVDNSGAARLLSKVFLGQLAAVPNDVGLSTNETLLKQDARATAQRLSTTHMPLNQVITGSGSVAVPGVLTCTISLPYDDPTNPFVHQYHPDHDNKDARFQLVGNGVESYTVTRTCAFTFTSTPPSGSTVSSGWGSSVIGGTYRETITGLHKNTLQLDGTFELRRASEIGTLSQ
ncbi:MAG: hypothetical protein ACKVY0_28760 [Prosthecobacter sp.]|uniref:hypothetical protein n=1 Tax=Prosthecobacter sp. TaxID=1965333 RepID=UPI0038FD7422